MDEIKDLFENLEKRQTYSAIAERSGVSRNTLFSVRKDPEKSSLRVLRSVARAMGYNLILTFQKRGGEEERGLTNDHL